MQKFVNLHGHTLGSVLDAIISPDELFAKAKEIGYKAMAITDHGNMSQIWAAYKASKKHGVKLIPGNEIYFVEDLADPKAKRRHLVLLASNAVGYRNLCRVTYEGFLNSVTVMGKQFPRVDAAILEKYKEGITATSACGGSIIAAHLYAGDTTGADRHAQIFSKIYGDRFYIELQPHMLSRGTFDQVTLNNMLKTLAERLNIKMVTTCDSHYLTAEDEKYHDMVLAISAKKALSDVNRHRYVSSIPCVACKGAGESCLDCGGTGIGEIIPCPEFYLKTEEEVRSFFSAQYSPEFAEQLIENTSIIADQCEPPTYLEPDGERLPTFDMKMIEGCSDAAEFKVWLEEKEARKAISIDNAFLRFRVARQYREYTKDFTKEKQKEYWKRLEAELDILENRGFCSYMLMVADAIDWAHRNDVWIGTARGSAGSSLIAFFLGIHKLDPMPYGLIFERFQNKERKQAPDIDTDVLSSGRDSLLAYMRERWGADYTAQITNVNRITPKVAIKDIAKSLEIGSTRSESFTLAASITKQIPLKVTKPDGKIIEINTLELAKQYSPSLPQFLEDYPEVEDYAKKIIGLPRSWGIHAGGIVVSDRPLPDYVPMRRDNDGIISVHYDKYAVEEIGLVKIDMLGLDTIDVLRETYMAARRIGNNIPKFWEIPEDDSRVYDMISRGDVLGLFQLEGSTLAKLCKPIKPKCIEDISLINALGRPGVDAEKRQQFIRRRNGTEKVKYAHPELEEIAKATLGISVYDEDLLKIASKIAGWSLSEADGLRKLTKLKEKGVDLAIKLEKKFVEDADKLGRVSKADAQMIWDVVIADYAKYGFCIDEDQEICTIDGNKKIKDLTVEDKVMWADHNGVNQYDSPVSIWRSGQKEVFEVSFEDGSQIRATSEHRFWSNGAWTKLSEIISDYGNVDAFGGTPAKLSIISVRSIGLRNVYDMEMPNEPHFCLPTTNGFVKAHNCKAHSVAYSKMGYATAYYKYYARAPFLCAYLNQEIYKETPATVDYTSTIKKEIVASGIALKACDINNSGARYTVVDKKTIVTGLNAIQGLGTAAAGHIFANQPYKCFADFIYRSPSAVNKTAVIALAKAGAFDNWAISRKWFVDTFSDEKKGKKLRDRINKQGDLFAKTNEDPKTFDWSAFVYDDPDLMKIEFSRREMLVHEHAVLGEFVTGSADEVYSNFFKNKDSVKKADLANMQDFSKILVEGMLTSIDSIQIKKQGKNFGRKMGRIKIESLKKEDFEISVFPDDWDLVKDKLVEGIPIITRCVVKRYNGEPSLSLQQIVDIWKDV